MILAIESCWGIVVSIPSLSILRMFVENSPVDNSFNGVDWCHGFLRFLKINEACGKLLCRVRFESA